MKQLSKIGSLYLLINTLNKAEKRYFKLISQLQKGNKVYLFLFELLEKTKNEEDIYILFNQLYPQKSIEMAAKHLYKVLLDSLIRLKEKQDIQVKIFNYITKANVLFERSLIQEAFFELEKAKALAITYENDALQLLIRRTELKYHSTLNFEGVTEKQLVGKQMKINEVMKYSRSINLHLQLHDILKHRLIYKGYARSDKQKSDLNDLVLSELNLIANNAYKGFEAEKIHLLFQAAYYLNSGNYTSALRYYKELIHLFETNPHMLLDPPIYYTSALRGILDSLHSAGLYKEMPFFIAKLQELEQQDYTNEFILEVKVAAYLYTLVSLLNTGNFNEAMQLYLSYEESLYKKIHLLNPESQLNLYLYTIILHLSTGDLTNARKYMKLILSYGKTFYALPSYKITRLINLLLQVESNRMTGIESEINSIKRNIQFEKQVYATEKLIFKFILAHPLPVYSKNRQNLWLQIKKEADVIRNNKYERQLLKTFDFLSWIESKLTKRPFAEVLQEKE
ncbi:hypothetical protein [Parabacteroides pacaensis]|uniref:hypothetical protein n=1 Tax=Parabacteroides pacaensis TaxID=2086575 RepID=UPI000D0F3F78|nr:hypothetical protein [Parabacteroides pacaensis]